MVHAVVCVVIYAVVRGVICAVVCSVVCAVVCAVVCVVWSAVVCALVCTFARSDGWVRALGVRALGGARCRCAVRPLDLLMCKFSETERL